jgi:transposase
VIYAYERKKHLQTIRRIPDELWDEIKIMLPAEKPNNTTERQIVPFRRVLDGICYHYYVCKYT